MKRLHILLSVAALMTMAGGAYADCREDFAQMQPGVSKDGSRAPLAEGTGGTLQTSDGQPATEMGGASASGEGIAKDGTQTPLSMDPGVATSAQDAQAQQQGGGMAAEVAGGQAGEAASASSVLEEAQAALDRGDEAACRAPRSLIDALQPPASRRSNARSPDDVGLDGERKPVRHPEPSQV